MKILSIITTVIILFSCSNPQDIEPNIIKIPVYNDTLNENGIKPLRKGFKWIYLVKTYDESGGLIQALSIPDSIVADTVIDKMKWFRTSLYMDIWQTNQTDGLRMRKYETGKPVNEWLEAKYPGTLQFTWQRDASQRRISGMDTSITVTAGIFSCYYYYDIYFNSGNKWEYSDLFYSSKTGLILSNTYMDKTSGGKYLSKSVELISFTKPG